MKLPALLPLLATLFILSAAGVVRAGDSGPDAPVKKPVARRAPPESIATTAAPAVRRDSRLPAPAFAEVRIARVRLAPPWLPGAPGD